MTAPLQILLIDDDDDDREIFFEIVGEAFEHSVCTFANGGQQALTKVNRDPSFVPDFIFLDINMPVMNGMECLAELKKIPHLWRVPVYMYSTSAQPKMVAECRKLGAAGFVIKEPDLTILKEELKKIILTDHSE
ncbi:MAG TPA: response regulator [Puia sp.]|nr:response regulator [Puia sp.]